MKNTHTKTKKKKKKKKTRKPERGIYLKRGWKGRSSQSKQRHSPAPPLLLGWHRIGGGGGGGGPKRQSYFTTLSIFMCLWFWGCIFFCPIIGWPRARLSDFPRCPRPPRSSSFPTLTDFHSLHSSPFSPFLHPRIIISYIFSTFNVVNFLEKATTLLAAVTSHRILLQFKLLLCPVNSILKFQLHFDFRPLSYPILFKGNIYTYIYFLI